MFSLFRCVMSVRRSVTMRVASYRFIAILIFIAALHYTMIALYYDLTHNNDTIRGSATSTVRTFRFSFSDANHDASRRRERQVHKASDRRGLSNSRSTFQKTRASFTRQAPRHVCIDVPACVYPTYPSPLLYDTCTLYALTYNQYLQRPAMHLAA